MPIGINAKSEARISHNIRVEYAEVPSIDVHGTIGWILVDGTVTFSETSAIDAAVKLNKLMKHNMNSVKDLIVACSSISVNDVADGLDLFPDETV